MTDEELVKALRDFADDGYADLSVAAADRIEQLVAINEALTAKLATCEKYRDAYAECDSIGTQAVRDLEAKLEKTVELLKEARQDLEEYVTHEWPKDEHPVYERKWERDMELCRRIDATLAEIEGLGVKQTG